MSADEVPSGGSLPKALDRVGSLVELLTTLDKRVLRALDAMEDMRGTMHDVQRLSAGGDDLVADLQERLSRLDERLNRDLDEIHDALLKKIGELDVDRLGARLERMEEAIFNIERATVNLDENFAGAIEMLPSSLRRRMTSEGKQEVPVTEEDVSGPPGPSSP